ncbi:rifin [Plasmodium reichenowi]|uniref:Rifin n=1 Tax=Plasmodium reichenowi TaxID=5854 RepID=A0A060RM24_PLARE|nr:rifin [Plasmodium reichenowi]
MKVHYINILLFAIPLNILAYNNNNKSYTTQHHKPTTRLLCECELYAPANYDNDTEMKTVMDNFNKQAQQRFHEYDNRMKTTRQKCKDQCAKEIQKIILKDKLEKQMAQQFATLQTDIQSDAIPTCICEKSLADKVEKGCLRCGGVFGGGVAPSVGLLGGIGEAAIRAWQTKAIAAAISAAKKGGAVVGEAAGNARGVEIVIESLKILNVDSFCPKLFNSIGTTTPYYDATTIINTIIAEHGNTCGASSTGGAKPICTTIGNKFNIIDNGTYRHLPTEDGITKVIDGLVYKAKQGAKAKAAEVRSATTAELTAQETNLINTTYASWQTAIIASVIAIVVIILIMVIIYLILRYRRKKKMKKKLQYIKLLEE